MSTPPPPYAELHCLTHFTFLRGASRPAELVQRAQQLGYRALAITDECSVAGVVRAHTAVQNGAQSLQLIIGAEFTLACGLKFVALATNRHGYARLCALITHGRRAAPKGSYHLTREDVQRHLEDCLILWLPGAVPAVEELQWLRSCFGANLWIAVELLLKGTDREYLAQLLDIGRDHAVPLVAAGDVHMHVRTRRRLQDALTAIRHGVTLAQAGARLYPNGERHLRERSRLARLYPPQLLAQTLQIAQRCTFSLNELRYEYPEELVPQGETPTTWLRKLVEEGVRYRWPQGASPQAREIIERELALIAQLGYEAYFLTVQDIVAYANENGILAQGRGSAANSLVCYCLRITASGQRLDSLLMERFISRERAEPPDIDIDFEHDRREEVIQYLYRKYGRERAALAATVISYRGRSALHDLARVFGFPEARARALARVVQWWDADVSAVHLREAGFDPDDPALRQIIQLSGELSGFPRHLSQHVGGFVIAASALSDLVPVENATMPERTVVQWNKDDLNDLGLLKVDVLGLGMLSALRRCFKLVNDWRGTSWTLGHLPPEDPQVYAMMSDADTIGVFQIESRAQMSMLPRLKPRTFYDLVIEVALVRPGPIQGDMVHPYLRRRNGEEPIDYPGPGAQAALERTMGVPIFQEQVMQLAMHAAGFTAGEADNLRRAMGSWERQGDLHRFKDQLASGLIANHYPVEFAERICKQIEGFGEYGFPECVVGETRVIDADTGRWRTIEEIMSGKIRFRSTLACDDSLRLRKRKVVAIVPVGVKSVWRLRTALGHTITATAEHPFMSLTGWRTLGDLRTGDYIAAARAVVDSDIYWDRVVEIQECGLQPTYDLQIDGDHNFLANNLIVHNSHAASFALLVYDSAWLKHYEPAAFTCALLNSQPMGFYAPAQLVRDARQHGVEVRPVSALHSDWDCTLEPAATEAAGAQPALRLGLRLVRSFTQQGAQRVMAARATRNFNSVTDLAQRAALERRDLEALAAAGALALLSGNRHLAFWEVAGFERALPLAGADPVISQADEGRPLLAMPTEAQSIVADMAAVGLTLGRHPVALLREQLQTEGLQCMADLTQLPHGQWARTAGLVLVRQRPGSAGGVTFMTLEDETAQLNVIVWKNIAERFRRPLVEAALLEVQGTLQREGPVLHLVARRLIDRTALTGPLHHPSRDFH
ncbi:MAG TPA: error-prone DNA polymerase [Steroidobacteraceae bacterium]|nr:error-prone DNA polymerase [Steroidobacteraceae bacterium]